jgi:hypothetical protein
MKRPARPRWKLVIARMKLAATAFLLLVVSAAGQPQPSPPQQDLVCHESGASNNGIWTMTGGGAITIRSVPANELKQTCEVSVRDRNGKTIFEDRGFSTKIDPATGRDIDNDGQPDAVVGVDTAGGSRGSWEYPVISFTPMPRLLLKLPPASFDFQTKPGKTLIWTSATFDDLGPSLAEISTVATVHEFRPNGFVDVTTDYCKPMLAGELQGPGSLRGQLAILTRQAKQNSRLDAGRPEDREDTRLAATTIVLQQIYCGQMEDASRLVLEVWPGSEQSRIRKQIRDAIANRWPELAKQLATWN